MEIMYPEDAAAGLEKPPNENAPLVIPEGWLSVGEQGDRSSEGTLEVSPDYVTLSTMDAAPSRQQRNEYIYEHVAECRGLARGPRVGCVQPAASTPERSSTRASCPSGMDILNRSYLLPAEGSRGLEPGPAAAPGGSDKRYTNMDAPTYPDAVA